MDKAADTAATPQAPPSAAPEAAPVARSIGERLRAGRERSGLSIAAAAEKLHLDPKVVECLEANRFADIGASVYVRGHLKRYADFVGESGSELVNLYASRETRAAAPDLRQAPQPERRSDPRRLVTPLVALGSTAVLLLAIWWVLAGSRQEDSSAVPATADATAPVPAPLVSATPATLSTGMPVTGPGEATPPGAATAATAAPVATVKEAAPVREIRLRLELSNDSWVEVYDSRGDRLFYDVASAGSVQSVTGSAPLRVVLENAAAVSVQVDGQAREIPANSIDGERARFVVNRSGSLSRSR
jgi:cytoskeleton protein RodZ